MTTLAQVKELTDAFDKDKIHYSIIAGFGLDALRGRLTKNHKDVDMLVLKKDYSKIKQVLESLRYTHELRADLCRAKRFDGAEADIDMVTIENNEALICGPSKITYIPRHLFETTRTIILEGVTLKIASNELLKLFGLWDRTGNYLEFAKTIPVNEELFAAIRRVDRV